MKIGAKTESGIAVLESNIFGEEDNHARNQLLGQVARTDVTVSIPVSYRMKTKPTKWDIESLLKSRSHNGLRLAMKAPVQVGTRTHLKAKLPGISKPFSLQGLVVWVTPSPNSQTQMECGVLLKEMKRRSRKNQFFYFIANKLCRIAIENKEQLTSRPARNLEDRLAAFRLVYRQYLKRQYCEPNPSGLHYTSHSLLPESKTFLLEKENKVLGTISLILDSPCGLPMESLFPERIGSLRKTGRKLAEVSLLALDSAAIGRKRFSLMDFLKFSCAFGLFKIMFDYARHAGITDLVIAMHPKHETLYRYLTFETVGPVRAYPGACGNPALPMRLDIARTFRITPTGHGIGAYFLRHSPSEELFTNHHVWTAAEVEKLLQANLKLQKKIDTAMKEYIKIRYSLDVKALEKPKESNRIDP